MRTYSGHSSAKESNALYKKNLAKGQTGLSIAFDLPTQTGYDADHELARGEVGKVGVPICSIEDMEQLFDDIPVEQMNTSMTINATAPWLLALYIAVCEKQGGDVSKLTGTTQNDLLKEFLSRGTYAFPPEPSLKLSTDLIAYTCQNIPKWNPINICPYHLQEAGATPVQELAFGLVNAITILDHVKNSAVVSDDEFHNVVGRISFFLDSGIRFIEEMCKTRAFTKMWDQICKERYGVEDPKLRRFRYGVQVNSLGLTEQQPENNIIRIVYELLGVTLAKNSRARAVQLPAWNEALGLPKPWDQQWSLRVQQILAEETDLLNFEDIFEGSFVIEEKTKALMNAAFEQIQKIEDRGGVLKALDSGYLKSELVRSNALRMQAIETGDQKIVGVNCYTQKEESPLGGKGAILKPNAKAEKEQVSRLKAFREKRDASKVEEALNALRQAVQQNQNIMPASIHCAHAGVTTGEWSQVMRDIYGTYRAPTGLAGVSLTLQSERVKDLREEFSLVEKYHGRKLRFLLGKPGLDGHSNGAEQIALKARDLGFEVIYQGIRMTPKEIVQSALQEDVDVIGLSILSGSHQTLIPDVMQELKNSDMRDVPVVVGGIIPPEDAKKLKDYGVAAVFTPKDFDLNKVFETILDLL
ncbi:MAG: protein meaA [Deltaproteobacteria bacterium]|nr:protein meaA [Deltaproteobacteria bacterium]